MNVLIAGFFLLGAIGAAADGQFLLALPIGAVSLVPAAAISRLWKRYDVTIYPDGRLIVNGFWATEEHTIDDSWDFKGAVGWRYFGGPPLLRRSRTSIELWPLTPQPWYMGPKSRDYDEVVALIQQIARGDRSERD